MLECIQTWRDHHLKIVTTHTHTHTHTHNTLLYKNLKVTTIQKSIMDTQKKRESDPHITLNTIIKSPGKWAKEERNKKVVNHPPTEMSVKTYLSIITSNVNGPNAPVKRQNGWMDLKNKCRLKWGNGKKFLCANVNKKCRDNNTYNTKLTLKQKDCK